PVVVARPISGILHSYDAHTIVREVSDVRTPRPGPGRTARSSDPGRHGQPRGTAGTTAGPAAEPYPAHEAVDAPGPRPGRAQYRGRAGDGGLDQRPPLAPGEPAAH